MKSLYLVLGIVAPFFGTMWLWGGLNPESPDYITALAGFGAISVGVISFLKAIDGFQIDNVDHNEQRMENDPSDVVVQGLFASVALSDPSVGMCINPEDVVIIHRDDQQKVCLCRCDLTDITEVIGAVIFYDEGESSVPMFIRKKGVLG